MVHDRDKPVFDIDLKSLRKQFLLLQQKAHPDSYSQAPKVTNKDSLKVNNKIDIF